MTAGRWRETHTKTRKPETKRMGNRGSLEEEGQSCDLGES